MKALISSNEPVQSGYRVAQVEPNANVFAVAEGLFWVDCSEEIMQDDFWYDPQDQTFKPVPAPEIKVGANQPTVSGADTL